ncbi:MAG TPA: hypothetical protein PLE74_08590 [Candidatus Cloacimonadota bacterium]|nr:hypothetical protein [Candidatus Cloacimonadota bacterium]HPT72325.1 hypothetical protein [Candidatus Cloacimonadota bacterium]
MKKMIILILASLLMLLGCSLKRSNPLDPVAHPGLQIPQDITEIIATPSSTHTTDHWVRLSWKWQNTQVADGYYVYRGQSYNGTYQRLATVTNTPVPSDTLSSSISWTDSPVVPGDYFYKLSAFKRQGSDSGSALEGHISNYKYVRVPQ